MGMFGGGIFNPTLTTLVVSTIINNYKYIKTKIIQRVNPEDSDEDEELNKLLTELENDSSEESKPIVEKQIKKAQDENMHYEAKDDDKETEENTFD